MSRIKWGMMKTKEYIQFCCIYLVLIAEILFKIACFYYLLYSFVDTVFCNFDVNKDVICIKYVPNILGIIRVRIVSYLCTYDIKVVMHENNKRIRTIIVLIVMITTTTVINKKATMILIATTYE